MSQSNPPSTKIICLGAGRTGTLSMASALEILGFGPSYHMLTRGNKALGDLELWYRAGNGDVTAFELLEDILQGYQSILDYQAAICAKTLYAAYPDAKYILTIRDPAKWEKSIKEVITNSHEYIKAHYPEEETRPYVLWFDESLLSQYHRGRLLSHTQEELLEHNERIKKLIPAQQLLVYEVGEGWERLAKFLKVPTPEEPFPHLNKTGELAQIAREGLMDFWKL